MSAHLWPWAIDTDGCIRTLADNGVVHDPITAGFGDRSPARLRRRELRIAAFLLVSTAAARISSPSFRPGRQLQRPRARGSYRGARISRNAGRRRDVGTTPPFNQTPCRTTGTKPIRHGGGSAGIATVHGARGGGSAFLLPRKEASPFAAHRAHRAPAAALSITSVFCPVPPAASSVSGVGACQPGYVLYAERHAAD